MSGYECPSPPRELFRRSRSRSRDPPRLFPHEANKEDDPRFRPPYRQHFSPYRDRPTPTFNVFSSTHEESALPHTDSTSADDKVTAFFSSIAQNSSASPLEKSSKGGGRYSPSSPSQSPVAERYSKDGGRFSPSSSLRSPIALPLSLERYSKGDGRYSTSSPSRSRVPGNLTLEDADDDISDAEILKKLEELQKQAAGIGNSMSLLPSFASQSAPQSPPRRECAFGDPPSDTMVHQMDSHYSTLTPSLSILGGGESMNSLKKRDLGFSDDRFYGKASPLPAAPSDEGHERGERPMSISPSSSMEELPLSPKLGRETMIRSSKIRNESFSSGKRRIQEPEFDRDSRYDLPRESRYSYDFRYKPPSEKRRKRSTSPNYRRPESKPRNRNDRETVTETSKFPIRDTESNARSKRAIMTTVKDFIVGAESILKSQIEPYDGLLFSKPVKVLEAAANLVVEEKQRLEMAVKHEMATVLDLERLEDVKKVHWEIFKALGLKVADLDQRCKAFLAGSDNNTGTKTYVVPPLVVSDSVALCYKEVLERRKKSSDVEKLFAEIIYSLRTTYQLAIAMQSKEFKSLVECLGEELKIKTEFLTVWESGYYFFYLIIENVIVLDGISRSHSLRFTENEAWHNFIVSSLGKDYLSIKEVEDSYVNCYPEKCQLLLQGKNYMRLELSNKLKDGFIRYDSIIFPKEIYHDILPLCRSCWKRGHLQFFCDEERKDLPAFTYFHIAKAKGKIEQKKNTTNNSERKQNSFFNLVVPDLFKVTDSNAILSILREASKKLKVSIDFSYRDVNDDFIEAQFKLNGKVIYSNLLTINLENGENKKIEAEKIFLVQLKFHLKEISHRETNLLGTLSVNNNSNEQETNPSLFTQFSHTLEGPATSFDVQEVAKVCHPNYFSPSSVIPSNDPSYQGSYSYTTQNQFQPPSVGFGFDNQGVTSSFQQSYATHQTQPVEFTYGFNSSFSNKNVHTLQPNQFASRDIYTNPKKKFFKHNKSLDSKLQRPIKSLMGEQIVPFSHLQRREDVQQPAYIVKESNLQKNTEKLTQEDDLPCGMLQLTVERMVAFIMFLYKFHKKKMKVISLATFNGLLAKSHLNENLWQFVFHVEKDAETEFGIKCNLMIGPLVAMPGYFPKGFQNEEMECKNGIWRSFSLKLNKCDYFKIVRQERITNLLLTDSDAQANNYKHYKAVCLSSINLRMFMENTCSLKPHSTINEMSEKSNSLQECKIEHKLPNCSDSEKLRKEEIGLKFSHFLLYARTTVISSLPKFEDLESLILRCLRKANIVVETNFVFKNETYTVTLASKVGTSIPLKIFEQKITTKEAQSIFLEEDLPADILHTVFLLFYKRLLNKVLQCNLEDIAVLKEKCKSIIEKSKNNLKQGIQEKAYQPVTCQKSSDLAMNINENIQVPLIIKSENDAVPQENSSTNALPPSKVEPNYQDALHSEKDITKFDAGLSDSLNKEELLLRSIKVESSIEKENINTDKEMLIELASRDIFKEDKLVEKPIKVEPTFEIENCNSESDTILLDLDIDVDLDDLIEENSMKTNFKQPIVLVKKLSWMDFPSSHFNISTDFILDGSAKTCLDDIIDQVELLNESSVESIRGPEKEDSIRSSSRLSETSQVDTNIPVNPTLTVIKTEPEFWHDENDCIPVREEGFRDAPNIKTEPAFSPPKETSESCTLQAVEEVNDYVFKFIAYVKHHLHLKSIPSLTNVDIVSSLNEVGKIEDHKVLINHIIWNNNICFELKAGEFQLHKSIYSISDHLSEEDKKILENRFILSFYETHCVPCPGEIFSLENCMLALKERFMILPDEKNPKTAVDLIEKAINEICSQFYLTFELEYEGFRGYFSFNLKIGGVSVKKENIHAKSRIVAKKIFLEQVQRMIIEKNFEEIVAEGKPLIPQMQVESSGLCSDENDLSEKLDSSRENSVQKEFISKSTSEILHNDMGLKDKSSLFILKAVSLNFQTEKELYVLAEKLNIKISLNLVENNGKYTCTLLIDQNVNLKVVISVKTLTLAKRRFLSYVKQKFKESAKAINIKTTDQSKYLEDDKLSKKLIVNLTKLKFFSDSNGNLRLEDEPQLIIPKSLEKLCQTEKLLDHAAEYNVVNTENTLSVKRYTPEEQTATGAISVDHKKNNSSAVNLDIVLSFSHYPVTSEVNRINKLRTSFNQLSGNNSNLEQEMKNLVIKNNLSFIFNDRKFKNKIELTLSIGKSMKFSSKQCLDDVNLVPKFKTNFLLNVVKQFLQEEGVQSLLPSIEIKLMKFIESFQVSSKNKKAFFLKAPLQIENLLKHTGTQENLEVIIESNEPISGSFMFDLLVGETFCLSLFVPGLDQNQAKSEALKTFLKYCLTEINSVDILNEQKKNKSDILKSVRVGFYTIQNHYFSDRCSSKFKEFAKRLKTVISHLESNIFQTMLSFAKDNGHNVEIEVETDVESQICTYNLVLDDERVYIVSFFTGKLSFPTSASKVGKKVDSILRKVFLQYFITALVKMCENLDEERSLIVEMQNSLSNRFYEAFLLNVHDSIKCDPLTADVIERNLKLTSITFEKPLIFKTIVLANILCLEMSLDKEIIFTSIYPNYSLSASSEIKRREEFLLSYYEFPKDSRGENQVYFVALVGTILSSLKRYLKHSVLTEKYFVQLSKKYKAEYTLKNMQIIINSVILWSLDEIVLSEEKSNDVLFQRFGEKLAKKPYFALSYDMIQQTKTLELLDEKTGMHVYDIEKFDSITLPVNNHINEEKVIKFVSAAFSVGNIGIEEKLRRYSSNAGITFELVYSCGEKSFSFTIKANNYDIHHEMISESISYADAIQNFYTSFFDNLSKTSFLSVDHENCKILFFEEFVNGSRAYSSPQIFKSQTCERFCNFLSDIAQSKSDSKTSNHFSQFETLADYHRLSLNIEETKKKISVTVSGLKFFSYKSDSSDAKEKYFSLIFKKVSQNTYFKLAAQEGETILYFKESLTNSDNWIRYKSPEKVVCLPEAGWQKDYPVILSENELFFQIYFAACENDRLKALCEIIFSIKTSHLSKLQIKEPLSFLAYVVNMEEKSLNIQCNYKYYSVNNISVDYRFKLESWEFFSYTRKITNGILSMADEIQNEFNFINELSKKFMSKVVDYVYVKVPKDLKNCTVTFSRRPHVDHKYNGYRFDAFCKPRISEDLTSVYEKKSLNFENEIFKENVPGYCGENVSLFRKACHKVYLQSLTAEMELDILKYRQTSDLQSFLKFVADKKSKNLQQYIQNVLAQRGGDEIACDQLFGLDEIDMLLLDKKASTLTKNEIQNIYQKLLYEKNRLKNVAGMDEPPEEELAKYLQVVKTFKQFNSIFRIVPAPLTARDDSFKFSFEQDERQLYQLKPLCEFLYSVKLNGSSSNFGDVLKNAADALDLEFSIYQCRPKSYKISINNVLFFESSDVAEKSSHEEFLKNVQRLFLRNDFVKIVSIEKGKKLIFSTLYKDGFIRYDTLCSARFVYIGP